MESRARLLGTMLAVSLLVAGCGPGSSHYPSDSSADEQDEGLCADESTRIAALEGQLEQARMQLEALEQRKTQLQSASESLRSNVERLASEDWREVIPDIDASASDVEDEADQMGSELSEAADVLQDR
jgi:chromosome segregation ATPase